jgi:hypothetical protein
MSSLQKFHRRTQSVGAATKFPTIGAGNNIDGYWLGAPNAGTGVYLQIKLIVAPKSTETSLAFGSYGIHRSTNASYDDGLGNTNFEVGFGSSITSGHPAAYYCKNLTTGGYNTWYLPSRTELNQLYTCRSATPFVTNDGFITSGNINYWSSSENNTNRGRMQNFTGGYQSGGGTGGSEKFALNKVRAVRQTTAA